MKNRRLAEEVVPFAAGPVEPNRAANRDLWGAFAVYVEEYGKENSQTIVMLHGAYFVHTFGRQYSLSRQYHLIVPHIMGFGNHTEHIFETAPCIRELADYIKSLNQKVTLVGFSLGAQLAFQLISDYEELFASAIIVSPWLIKEEPFLSEMEQANLKQLHSLHNRVICNFVGLLNGLPPKPRKAFVSQMQNVKAETIRNVVYNGITIERVPSFANVSVPVIALAGAKEQREVTDSVRKMARINPNCKYEIWEKAAHNIPPVFYKRFNELIRSMA